MHRVLPSGAFCFTGVGFVAVNWLILSCITLYYPGSMRVFFGGKALALISGFAAHDRSFVTKTLYDSY